MNPRSDKNAKDKPPFKGMFAYEQNGLWAILACYFPDNA